MLVKPLLQWEAKRISEWKYPSKYAVYSRSLERLHPLALHFGVHDGREELIGFAALGSAAYGASVPTDTTALDVAFALEPLRMRQGIGLEFARTVVAFAESQATCIGTTSLRLVVEDWNLVALETCRSMGFIPESTAGTRIVLTRPTKRVAADALDAGYYLG